MVYGRGCFGYWLDDVKTNLVVGLVLNLIWMLQWWYHKLYSHQKFLYSKMPHYYVYVVNVPLIGMSPFCLVLFSGVMFAIIP